MGIGATTLLTAVVGAVVALLGAVGARQLLANYDGRKTAKQKGEREERREVFAHEKSQVEELLSIIKEVLGSVMTLATEGRAQDREALVELGVSVNSAVSQLTVKVDDMGGEVGAQGLEMQQLTRTLSDLKLRVESMERTINARSGLPPVVETVRRQPPVPTRAAVTTGPIPIVHVARATPAAAPDMPGPGIFEEPLTGLLDEDDLG